MKKRIFILAVISVGLIVLYNNCGQDRFGILQGTSTGNPGPQEPNLTELVKVSCIIMTGCHRELKQGPCEDGVLDAFSVPPRLHYDGRGEPTTLRHIIQLRTRSPGDLLVAPEDQEIDQLALTRCMSHVAQLTCLNPEVQQAYDPTQPDPFAKIHEIYTPTQSSCGGVFR